MYSGSLSLKRILIRPPGPKLGDFMMMTPTLLGIRESHPDAEITLLLWPNFTGDWLPPGKLFDKVLWDDKDGQYKGVTGALRLSNVIRQANFDAVIFLHGSSRSAWICRIAGVPTRIGSTTKWYRRFYTHCIVQTRAVPDRHEVQYNYDLVRPIGVSGEPGKMYWPLTADDRKSARELLRTAGWVADERFVVLNATHGGSSRPWPADRFAKAVGSIANQCNTSIVLIGGPDCRDYVSQLTQQLDANVKSIDVTGATTLPTLAGILEMCLFHLSVDTGTMHLAAAVGAPCVTIFPLAEFWDQRIRWLPWKVPHRIIGPGTRCTDCIPGRCFRTQSTCIESISHEQVVSEAILLTREQSQAD